jgi:hypothetical protein
MSTGIVPHGIVHLTFSFSRFNVPSRNSFFRLVYFPWNFGRTHRVKVKVIDSVRYYVRHPRIREPVIKITAHFHFHFHIHIHVRAVSPQCGWWISTAVVLPKISVFSGSQVLFTVFPFIFVTNGENIIRPRRKGSRARNFAALVGIHIVLFGACLGVYD